MNPNSALCSYDVAVLGDGMAGAATALALRRQRLRVVLVGRRRRASPRIGETVPGRIVQSLARLGVWDAFLAAGHLSVAGNIVSWGDEHVTENDGLLNAFGPPWHLDREHFDAMLLSSAINAGAQAFDQSAASCVRRPDRGWDLRCGSSLVSARWVVDATGRSSWFARRQAVSRSRIDRLVATSVLASASPQGETRTVIEAVADGWWYAAALPNARLIVSFYTDVDLVPHGNSERAQYWWRRFSETRLISRVVSPAMTACPVTSMAATSRLTKTTADGWFAVGDAAGTYDPLSGQGIETALQSALAAADAIVAERDGDAQAKDRYARAFDAQFDRYLKGRIREYARESRWCSERFWSRRHKRLESNVSEREAVSNVVGHARHQSHFHDTALEQSP